MIYFHAPGQFLDLNGRLGHNVMPGQSVETQVTYQDAKMLPTLDMDGKPTCSHHHYDACMYESMAKSMTEEVRF